MLAATVSRSRSLWRPAVQKLSDISTRRSLSTGAANHTTIKGDYTVVDHTYDAIVVGAGIVTIELVSQQTLETPKRG